MHSQFSPLLSPDTQGPERCPLLPHSAGAAPHAKDNPAASYNRAGAKPNEQPRGVTPQYARQSKRHGDQQKENKKNSIRDAVHVRNSRSTRDAPPDSLDPPLHGCHHCRLGLRHGRLYLQLLARQRTVLRRPLGREGRTHRPNARRLPSNAAAPLPPHHPPPTPTVANRIALMSLREGELVRWQPHRGRRRSLPPQCREAS